MALSVPVNGLKEGDKEPVIELFVKVRRRRRWWWWCVGGLRPVQSRPGAERASPLRRALRPLGAPSPNRRFPARSRPRGSKFPSATCGGAGGETAASMPPPPPSPPTVGVPPPPRRAEAPFGRVSTPKTLRAPAARRERGALLRAAPGRAVGDAPVVRRGARRPRTKGPFGGAGVRGAGAESVCTDGASDNANRK